MRKTKIVCTIGPACDSKEMMRKMIDAGMNVARINMSHGVYDRLEVTIKNLKEAIAESGQNVAILLDTKGPEVRVGTFKDGSVELVEGAEFSLFKNKEEGDETGVSLSFPKLVDIFESEGQKAIGRELLLDDGIISLVVKSVNPESIVCTVNKGGVLKNRKSINIPGSFLNMPYVSAQDRKDIEFGLNHGATVVAASFVRNHDDVRTLRDFIDSLGYEYVEIIAKIENQDGVDNIDDILRVADGIMVARGDMGVEIPFVEIPRIQKELIHKGYNAGKQVITATQMLDSMIKNPRPTRAETTDVANAIYDGTSAIMLSGETAAGAYPIDAVKTMKAIAVKTEQDIDYRKRFFSRENEGVPNVTNAIAHATVTTSIDLGATAILTVTKGGRTARTLSKFRPTCPIIAATTSERAQRQLNLSWGVIPIKSEEMSDSDSLFDHAVTRAMEEGLLKDGDLIVITAGLPLGVSGTTNMMKVHIVGDVLLKGKGATAKAVTAPVCVCKNEEDAIKLCHSGDILVIPKTSNNIMSVLKSAAGIVVEDTNPDCHAAVVGQALDIPVIYGAENASNVLKSGVTVTIDAEKGLICSSNN